MTRYGKELSMVKIPSKASAKYLAKKFNKSEQYIGYEELVSDLFFFNVRTFLGSTGFILAAVYFYHVYYNTGLSHFVIKYYDLP